MAEQNSTAERELLKTIEGGPGAAGAPANLKPFSRPDFLKPIKEKLSFMLEKLKAFSFNNHKVGLSFIKRGMIVLVLILSLSLGFNIMRGLNKLQNIPRFNMSDFKPKTSANQDVELPLKKYTYYGDVLLGRNIFNPNKEEEAVQKAQSSRINEMTKNLRVVGISWLDNDDQKELFAMVEDIQSELTYFLKEGDRVANLVVKKITQDSLILSYGVEEIELR